ncbi:MAG: hypothetical protein J6S14_02330 [Clostridia bacterium]|nr:hypothetical protein [Clostridia bacterium]
MGIYIKGMEMPTRCEDCFCYRNNAEFDYAYCCISDVNVLGHGNARLNNCPLIPVPPHGRLIDADALCELCDIMADKCDGVGESIWHHFRTTVEWTPTIIPAEEGE